MTDRTSPDSCRITTSGAAIQPVLWVSPEQFANFMDSDEAPFGKYVPARKTCAGNFTMPLFAAPAQPAPEPANADRTHALRASHGQAPADYLAQREIPFVPKNGGAHLIVEGRDCFIDFWPGTGKWHSRCGKKGFGVRNLVAFIETPSNAESNGHTSDPTRTPG